MTAVTKDAIRAKMEELAKKLDYEYKDLGHLTNAMNVTKIDNTAKSSYANSSMATVGDVVLKLIIADNLLRRGMTRGDITVIKSSIESNSNYREISEKLGLRHYAYNTQYFFDDAPDHLKLPSGEHDVYLEAVACAVFHDVGFDACREWVEKIVLPSIKL